MLKSKNKNRERVKIDLGIIIKEVTVVQILDEFQETIEHT